MNIGLDGGFWSHYFERVFVPQIDKFYETIVNRLIPAFQDIDKEAEEIAQAEYKRLGALPYIEGGDDLSVAAEKAFEMGLTHYEALHSVRQAIINLSAAALFHLYEQQVLVFHRRQVLHPSEENDPGKIQYSVFVTRLCDAGVDIKAMSDWGKLDELRLIANSVKHAEGPSAVRLRNVRPDLFTPPSITGLFDEVTPPARLYLPLAGEDLYVTTDDLELYRTAVVSFWHDLGESIKHM